MGKRAHDDVLDGPFGVLNDADLLLVCSAEPTDRANALALALSDAAMAPGDFTNANGDISGRKCTVASKSAPVDSSGNASHVALCDATRLLYVTTCGVQALTIGNTINTPAWDVEFADPV